VKGANWCKFAAHRKANRIKKAYCCYASLLHTAEGCKDNSLLLVKFSGLFYFIKTFPTTFDVTKGRVTENPSFVLLPEMTRRSESLTKMSPQKT
jgi:hypothetical protein